MPSTPTVVLGNQNTRHFESFHKEFTNRHVLLSNKLENLATTLRDEKNKEILQESRFPTTSLQQMKSDLKQGALLPFNWPSAIATARFNTSSATSAVIIRVINDELRETLEAASFARDWHYGAHLGGFRSGGRESSRCPLVGCGCGCARHPRFPRSPT